MNELLDELQFLFARLDWRSSIDILLVALVIYALLVLVRGTQAIVLLRGVLLLALLIALLTSFIPLPAFSWLMRNTLPALFVAVPVIFAPEIRRALERLGRAGTVWHLGGSAVNVEQLIDTLATAAQRLSERRHGGLIIIERQAGLREYMETGIQLDATVTVEVLLQIFYPNTPLHDGAVIITGHRLQAAACVMPLSSGKFVTDRQIGLRHRAALGITEATDAVAIIISEETGQISVAYNGRMIRRLDVARLKHILAAFYRPHGTPSFFESLRQRLAGSPAPRPAPPTDSRSAPTEVMRDQ